MVEERLASTPPEKKRVSFAAALAQGDPPHDTASHASSRSRRRHRWTARSGARRQAGGGRARARGRGEDGQAGARPERDDGPQVHRSIETLFDDEDDIDGPAPTGGPTRSSSASKDHKSKDPSSPPPPPLLGGYDGSARGGWGSFHYDIHAAPARPPPRSLRPARRRAAKTKAADGGDAGSRGSTCSRSASRPRPIRPARPRSRPTPTRAGRDDCVSPARVAGPAASPTLLPAADVVRSSPLSAELPLPAADVVRSSPPPPATPPRVGSLDRISPPPSLSASLSATWPPSGSLGSNPDLASLLPGAQLPAAQLVGLPSSLSASSLPSLLGAAAFNPDAASQRTRAQAASPVPLMMASPAATAAADGVASAAAAAAGLPHDAAAEADVPAATAHAMHGHRARCPPSVDVPRARAVARPPADQPRVVGAEREQRRGLAASADGGLAAARRLLQPLLRVALGPLLRPAARPVVADAAAAHGAPRAAPLRPPRLASADGEPDGGRDGEPDGRGRDGRGRDGRGRDGRGLAVRARAGARSRRR